MLNKEQQLVVNFDEGPLLCIAGAGSGKTHTITYKVANLIKNGTDPSNILMLTFTNKAAEEMKERINNIVGSDISNKITAGTYHSFCVKILAKYGHSINLPRNFSIMSERNSKILIDTMFKTKNIDLDEYRNFKKIDTKAFKNIFSTYRNTCYSINESIQKILGTDNLKDFEYIFISELYEEYQEYKFKNKMLDFDDILKYAEKMLYKNPDIAKAISDQYKYILVDEYQDSNHTQLNILKALRSFDNQNICVVGDDIQSIYAFRGADFNNILNFEKDFPNAKIIQLTENYRSSSEILELTNSIIANSNEGFKKVLTSVKGSNNKKPRIIRPYNSLAQASFIVGEIFNKINSENASPSDFGIIARTGYELNLIEQKLVEYGVPYQKYGGLSLFDRVFVENYLCLVSYFCNHLDHISLLSLLQLIPGIGPKIALDIVSNIENYGLEDAIYKAIPRKYYEDLASFFNTIEKLRSKSELAEGIGNIPEELLDLLFKMSIDSIENSNKNSGSKKEEIKVIKNDKVRVEVIIQAFSEAKDIFEFERGLGLGRLEKEPLEDGTVTITTVHSAKGLEFKYVYVTNVIEGSFPILSRFSSNSKFFEDLINKKIEEERRVFYVATSRAKDELTISIPKFIGFRNEKESEDSRYVQELFL